MAMIKKMMNEAKMKKMMNEAKMAAMAMKPGYTKNYVAKRMPPIKGGPKIKSTMKAK